MLKLKKFHRPNIVQHFHHFIRVFLTRQDWVDFGRATSGKQIMQPSISIRMIFKILEMNLYYYLYTKTLLFYSYRGNFFYLLNICNVNST